MAEPVVQEQAVVIPTADVVGNAFARQYYTILQQSPALVHRFYQDISKIGRVGDGGVMSSITTMRAIDEKIQSYGSLKADVKFVDAQESYNGGVIVQVTGFMVDADDSKRGFTQTFFLAPQDKGYFVLNDIFRYLENDLHHSVKQDDGIAPPTASQANPVLLEETSAVQENQNSEQSNVEVYNPSDNGDVTVEELEEEEVEEEGPVAEVVVEAPNEPQVVVESGVKAEDLPKKSYAMIVKVAPATTSHNLPKSVPKMQEQQAPVAPAPTPSAVAPASSAHINGNILEKQASDGHSIYIRNLPMNTSYDLVEEEFKRFGSIKSGSIQIRNNKGFCFGFVEFEVASAVQSAVEASPITIGGREVVIEEKKSTSSRGSNRGRFPGRVGGYRGDGGRGRGSYGGGGRGGYGRGEINKNEFGFNRSNSRGHQNNHRGGYQEGGSNDQMGNGVPGRVNRGGAFGTTTSRAQRVPALA